MSEPNDRSEAADIQEEQRKRSEEYISLYTDETNQVERAHSQVTAALVEIANLQTEDGASLATALCDMRHARDCLWKILQRRHAVMD